MKLKLMLKLILVLVGLIPLAAISMEKPNPEESNKEVLKKAAQDKRAILDQRWRLISSRRPIKLPNLTRAVTHNKIAEAKKLLASGADINVVDSDLGQTPLIRALSIGEPEMASVLIENGADVNKRNLWGDTALSLASSVSFVDRAAGSLLVKKLIAAGSDIDNKNELGETPLMLAVVYDHPDIVKLLLDEGADSLIVNDEGDTAYDIAKNKRDDRIIQMLASYQIKKEKLQ